MMRKLMVGIALAGALGSIAGCGGGGSNNNNPASRSIGPAGGFLTVALGFGTAKVTIPANAVATNTQFTLSRTSTFPPDPAPDKPVLKSTPVTLSPSTAFAKPVTITLSYNPADIPAGKTPANLLMCKATAANGWVRIQATDSVVDAQNHTVTDMIDDTNGTRPYAVLAVK